MTLDNTSLEFIISGAYKISCLAAGTLICWMGYKLFVRGVWGDAGNVTLKSGEWSVLLKHGAPGTFFALFGAGVLVATIWHGMSLDYSDSATSPGSDPIAITATKTATATMSETKGSNTSMLPNLSTQLPNIFPNKLPGNLLQRPGVISNAETSVVRKPPTQIASVLHSQANTMTAAPAASTRG
jgi:hypothetical protein